MLGERTRERQSAPLISYVLAISVHVEGIKTVQLIFSFQEPPGIANLDLTVQISKEHEFGVVASWVCRMVVLGSARRKSRRLYDQLASNI
jgi:hypothetical protein